MHVLCRAPAPRSRYPRRLVIYTILGVAQLVYVVTLATWILFEKRSPVATLAWILALVALPYVGFVVFFVLGPRRVRRKRLKHKRARGKVQATSAAVAAPHGPTAQEQDPRIAQLVHLATHAGEPPAERCDSVTILGDAASTYDAIEKAIAEAQHHVHIGYYIFDPRRTGSRFREALLAARKRGVIVRLLVDDVGSGALHHKFVQPLRDAGVYFARFNPVVLSRIRSRIDFRNHRKIVVCDGRIGFTGGINIADEYLPGGETSKPAREARKLAKRGHLGPWRDTHVRIVGDAVRWLQLTFLDDWYYATGYAAKGDALFPPRARDGSELVQIVASGPDRDFEPIQKLYFAAIATARERVYVTTPYFVPDDAVLTALTTAALRGVDVRVLVPRRSDSLIVTAAARSYYDTILAAGVRVYEYQPTMIHAKTLVVDDYFAAVGTANMDNRSFRLNFEVTAVLYGEQHASELVRHFRHDLRDSKEIKVRARQKLPLRWRLGEAGARVLSPLL
ncbi:MAG TPA: cardiolipin synthase [Labilithrix sp.]